MMAEKFLTPNIPRLEMVKVPPWRERERGTEGRSRAEFHDNYYPDHYLIPLQYLYTSTF